MSYFIKYINDEVPSPLLPDSFSVLPCCGRRNDILAQTQGAHMNIYSGPSTSSRNEDNSFFNFPNRQNLRTVDDVEDNYLPTLLPMGQNPRSFYDPITFQNYSKKARIERPERTGLCRSFACIDSSSMVRTNDNIKERNTPANNIREGGRLLSNPFLLEVPIALSKKKRQSTFEQSMDVDNIDVKAMPRKKKMLELQLAVNDYKPEELKVKLIDDTIVIEGKKEIIIDDYIMSSKKFMNKYQILKKIDKEKLFSSISSDGMLTVCAPYIKENKEDEREIPIVSCNLKSRMRNLENEKSYEGMKGQQCESPDQSADVTLPEELLAFDEESGSEEEYSLSP